MREGGRREREKERENKMEFIEMGRERRTRVRQTPTY